MLPINEIIFLLVGAGLLTSGALVGYNKGIEAGKLRQYQESQGVQQAPPRKSPNFRQMQNLPLLDPVSPGEGDPDGFTKKARQKGNRSSR